MKPFSCKISLQIAAVWFLGIIMSAIFCGVIFAAVQQDLRQSANDPQIEAAEDIAAVLDKGQQPSAFDADPTQRVDIAKSLSPFILIYNLQGKPLASSGELNGATPSIPLSALQASTSQDKESIFSRLRSLRASGEDKENRITWQPQSGVRSALVITSFTSNGGGYVVAGRSLREVEQREDHILKIIVAGLSAIIFVWTVAISLLYFLPGKWRKILRNANP